MDQFYVTPDGQIAQLPRRSFLDRLTSGLYDASVEFRRPGGGQEARLARTQPLTSALNQYGQQRREFDQQGGILERRQGFESEQSALDRAMRTKLAADELAQQRALTQARLAQDQSQFQATHGLAREAESRMQLGQNLKGWDTARQMMIEYPQVQAQIELNKARAANDLAQQKLYEAQTSALSQTVSPEALALMGALNPKLTPAIAANPGLTNMPVATLGKVLAAREGTSGQMNPLLTEMLLGGQRSGPQLRSMQGTNAPAVIDLTQ